MSAKTLLKRLLSSVAAVLLTVGAGAQEAPRNEALGFLRISPDPETAAMGYAGRAAAGPSAWAAFRNPGSIPFQEGTFAVAGAWQRWAPQGENAGMPAGGAAVKIGQRFGLSAGYLQLRSPYDADLGFAPTDRHLAVGAALAVSEHVSAGISYHALRSELLSDYALQSGAADLLLTARLGDFRLCGGVAGLGSLVQGNVRTPIPTSAVLAGDWARRFGRHGLRLDADLDYFPGSRSFTAAAGAEYSFAGIAFLRGGYHFAAGPAPVLPSFATLGAGVRFAGFRLDLAWLPASPALAGTLLLSAGFAW